MFAKMKNDSTYLDRNHYYLADRSGKKIDHTKLDFDAMTIRTFTYYVVQSPGPHNALGRVKFMFPNKHAIYLHDTPSKSLFDRSSRAFSHGCIRVQNPLKLAEILLDDEEKYSMDKIEEIIAEGELTNVSLKTPKKIMLAYLTVGINDDGVLTFHEDVYNRDLSLYMALIAAPK
jgi:murein L,D-transpeptidase YcbB/YkuD